MPKLFWINQNAFYVSSGSTASEIGNFYIGSTYSSPDWTQFGNRTAFVGAQGTHEGTDIWVTDGTNAGTHEITLGAFASALNLVNNYLVFNENGFLWSADDNTLSGAQAISSLQNVTPLVPTANGFEVGVFSNGKYALFDGKDPSGYTGLWVTDGTSAGSSEIVPGKQGSYGFEPEDFQKLGNEVLFTAGDRNGNRGVWITDGSMAGTTELVSGGFGSLVANYDDTEALFVGSAHGQSGLWVTDGTLAGTQMIVPSAQGSYSLSPQDITPFRQEQWVFAGADSSGRIGLWESDGAADNSFEILGGAQGAYSLSPGSFVDFFGLLFVGTDATGGRGLWISNTVVGNLELASGMQGTYKLNPSDFTNVAFDDEYFAATDSAGYAGVWRTDGTVAGTKEVVKGQQFTQSLDPFGLIDFGSKLAFLGTDGGGNVGVWVTDGTTTTEVLGGKQGVHVLNPGFLTMAGGSLMFAGTDADGVDVEWASDGTAAGTKIIASSGSTDPYSLGDTQYLAGDFAPSDFNGDGNSDILFENTSGAYATWQMNGATIAGGGQVQSPSAAWTVVGTGDYNSDGYSDIYVQNATTGLIDALIVVGSSVVATLHTRFPATLAEGWTVAAIGDLNGDGATDILYRDYAGDFENDFDLRTLEGPGPGWTFVGTCDFNGDGVSDLLFENAQGSYATWLIDNFSIAGGATLGTPGQGWVEKGIGLNAEDQTSTIVFLNEDTGMVATWKIKDDAVVGGGAVGAPGPQWTIKSVGDYNGDGYSDILFYNVVTGQYATWELNAAQSGKPQHRDARGIEHHHHGWPHQRLQLADGERDIG